MLSDDRQSSRARQCAGAFSCPAPVGLGQENFFALKLYAAVHPGPCSIPRVERRNEMDYTTLAVAAMSLIGTLTGTFGGILVANKLTTYRIDQLEKKVSEHNKLVERTYKLEGQMVEVQHDIRDLKAERG